MNDVIQFLSPRAAKLAALLVKHKTPEALAAAHPEVTASDIDNLCAELFKLGKSPAKRRPKRGKKAARTAGMFQIKITLRGTKPPIWRRVTVPAEITLEFLHDVIQIAMGWDNAHLHQFKIHGEVYSGRTPDGEMLDDMDGCDEAEFRLCDVVDVKSKFRYEYDFGDNWEHDILVEKLIPAAEAPKGIACLAGKGCCPPEDCGGLWGYYNNLAVLANPKHPEHDEIAEWMGEIDPNAFDCAAASMALGKLKW